MFKAHHASTGTEILILDRRWSAQVETLRALDAQDQLVCPGCRQPVRVRAGEVKRWHFAHKHLENCPYESASLALLKMRACLYDWLVTRFDPDSVTVEVKPDAVPFYRPIDCWVSQGTRAFAYWFFDRRMPPDERYKLADGFESLGIPVTWAFAAHLLRVDQANPRHRLHTTTTERAFIQGTTFDAAWRTHLAHLGGSLHYLDPDRGTLTTYRNLSLVHKPQLYSGTRLQHGLGEVQVSPANGEFIHPGEPEQLQKRSRQLAEQQRRADQRLQRAETFFKTVSERKGSLSYARDAAPPAPPFARQGTCRICGTVTTDWVTYFGETAECICRSCKEQ